jgi:hypothetical protein
MQRPQTDFFIYSVSLLALANAGGVGSAILNIDASSDFMWYYSTFTAYTSGANTAWTDSNRQKPPINLLITPGDTSSNFMSQAMPVTHIFGNGENPFVLPAPRKIPARTTITFAATNSDTTLTYDLWLSLIGVKIYAPQQG